MAQANETPQDISMVANFSVNQTGPQVQHAPLLNNEQAPVCVLRF